MSRRPARAVRAGPSFDRGGAPVAPRSCSFRTRSAASGCGWRTATDWRPTAGSAMLSEASGRAGGCPPPVGAPSRLRWPSGKSAPRGRGFFGILLELVFQAGSDCSSGTRRQGLLFVILVCHVFHAYGNRHIPSHTHPRVGIHSSETASLLITPQRRTPTVHPPHGWRICCHDGCSCRLDEYRIDLVLRGIHQSGASTAMLSMLI